MSNEKLKPERSYNFEELSTLVVEEAGPLTLDIVGNKAEKDELLYVAEGILSQYPDTAKSTENLLDDLEKGYAVTTSDNIYLSLFNTVEEKSKKEISILSIRSIAKDKEEADVNLKKIEIVLKNNFNLEK